MTRTTGLTAKFLGSMLGSALGDAIGEIAFRTPNEADLRTWIAGTGKLSYTDDTAMAIGLAQSLARLGRLDPQRTFPGNRFVNDLMAFARTTEMRDKLEMVRSLLAQDSPAQFAAPRLGQNVTAHGSVPFALYAFLRHPHSYQDCLFCAILNGGDRDTLGAMACAVSGAYLGIGAIPPDWRTRLENRAQIEELACQLANMKRREEAS